MTKGCKYCVYTVITGGFDNVLQPQVIDNRFDYILFTDDVKDDNNGVWSVRGIDYSNVNPRVVSRYPKVCPHEVLSEYAASLYIDGNISISSHYVYDHCVELAEKGVEWAGIKHQGRSGMCQEINAIIGLGWVHDYDVLDWYHFLQKDGFPDDLGIFENNIIFRSNCENVAKVNEFWWWTIRDGKVQRDQFSLMWALWKVPPVRTEYFLTDNENAWHNEGHFFCESHNPHKRVLKKSLWEKMRDRYVRMFYWNGDWEIYYTHWFDKLVKWPCPHLAMHLWTAWVLVRYDLKFMAGRVWQRLAGKRKHK